MTQRRERRLVMDGSVCEDAHSFRDPNVSTVEDARERGSERCPVFDECMYRNMLDRRRIRCAAMFGQRVARFALEDGVEVPVEMAEFRREAFSTANGEIAGFGFIDPYKDPSIVENDPGKATAMVEEWATTILYGPAESAQ